MTGLYDDEEMPSNVKAQVMNAVNLVNRNPFITMTKDMDLVSVFEDFASNVNTAMTKLETLTGVEIGSNPAADAEMVEHKVLTYLHQSEERGQTLELVLSSAFMKEAFAPYSALQKLDRAERQGQVYDPMQARMAMDGLKALQLFAKVVPAVYKTISQDQGLSLASVA